MTTIEMIQDGVEDCFVEEITFKNNFSFLRNQINFQRGIISTYISIFKSIFSEKINKNVN